MKEGQEEREKVAIVVGEGLLSHTERIVNRSESQSHLHHLCMTCVPRYFTSLNVTPLCHR